MSEQNGVLCHFAIPNVQVLKKVCDCYGAMRMLDLQIFFYEEFIKIYAVNSSENGYKVNTVTFLYKKYLINFFIKKKKKKTASSKKSEDEAVKPIYKIQIEYSSLQNVIDSSVKSSKNSSIAFCLKEKEIFDEESGENITTAVFLIRVGDTEHTLELKDFIKINYIENEKDFDDNYLRTQDLDEWNCGSGIWKGSNKLFSEAVSKAKPKHVTDCTFKIKIGNSIIIETYNSLLSCIITTPIPGILPTLGVSKSVVKEISFTVNTGNLGYDFFKKAALVGGATGTGISSAIVASKKDNYLTLVQPLNSFGEMVCYFEGEGKR